MMLHASTNSRTPIHGILIGQQSSDQCSVTDIVPVSHSNPTKPIIDMALRFTEEFCRVQGGGLMMVGWYTANERVGDNTPSPIAWKVVANMKETLSSEPILAIITSDSFEVMLRKECTADGQGKGFKVYSNCDESSEAVEDIKAENGDWSEVSALVADICLKGNAKLCDFENHLEGGVEENWLKNEQVAKIV